MVNKTIKTIFNYIGGKSWLREHLRAEVNSVLNNYTLNSYVEPFAGGLGAFISIYDILIEHGVKNVILNDINGKLINFYQVVNESPEELIKAYMIWELEYEATITPESRTLHKTKDKDRLKIALATSDAYYKKVRDNFNKPQDKMTSAVSLLFLQNHCFNGIYRENSKGGYNTPFNWEARSFPLEKIAEKVMGVHNVFKQFNIEFTNKSFQNLEYNKEALYYLDPPYINEVESQENQYNKDSFNVDKQKLLIETIKDTCFIYSNHDNELLINEFKKHNVDFNVKKISRKNIISASVESRKTDKLEILISKK